MSKKEKPAVKAPTQEAGTTQPATVAKAFVPKEVSGMSPDAQVQYFATLHDRYGKPGSVPDTVKGNIGFINAMNAVADAIAVSIAIEEAVNNNTVFHAIVSKKDKPAYAAICAIASEYGYELPEVNLLPAPTQEQLAQAGKPGETTEDKGTVTIDPGKVSKKAKAAIAAEKKVTDSKPAESPVDVKDEAQLKASLLNIFVKGERPVARAKKAINFYRAYLKIQKKDDKNELKKIDEMSDITLLDEVKNIIGPCPYKDSGISAFLRGLVAKSGTPIEAFCILYRSAHNRKTGEMEATNELIAAICRAYVIWSCESVISEAKDVIESETRQLKKLDENNPKHKDGIDAIKKNIEDKNADIKWANDVIDSIVNPESELIDNLIDAYNDDKNENHNIAVSIFDAILKTIYPNEDMTKYEAECVENNPKHKDGIDAIKKNIEDKNADIKWANDVIDSIVNPESELIDNLIDAYNNDKNENHNIAVSIFDAILKTIYPNEDMTKYEAECVENNVKQYAGVICNMFRDPASQLAEYSLANLVEMVKIEDEKPEEKPQEEEPKK